MNERFFAEQGKVLEYKVGSHLYGTNTPASDVDYSGVFVAPEEYYLGLDSVEEVDLSVVSKRAEIMTVLTTNFVEKLNPVILRPGRLDAVITLRAPNAKTAERLMRHYAAGLLDAAEDMTAVGVELEGQIPASIRECVERAKLGMIGRAATTLSADDLMTAAKTMKNHLSLLNRKQAEETAPEALARSLKAVIQNGHGTLLEGMNKKVEELHDHIM